MESELEMGTVLEIEKLMSVFILAIVLSGMASPLAGASSYYDFDSKRLDRVTIDDPHERSYGTGKYLEVYYIVLQEGSNSQYKDRDFAYSIAEEVHGQYISQQNDLSWAKAICNVDYIFNALVLAGEDKRKSEKNYVKINIHDYDYDDYLAKASSLGFDTEADSKEIYKVGSSYYGLILSNSKLEVTEVESVPTSDAKLIFPDEETFESYRHDIEDKTITEGWSRVSKNVKTYIGNLNHQQQSRVFSEIVPIYVLDRTVGILVLSSAGEYNFEQGDFGISPAFSIISEEGLSYTFWYVGCFNDIYTGKILVASELPEYLGNKANADDLVSYLAPFGDKFGVEPMCGIPDDSLREIVQGSRPDDLVFGGGIRTFEISISDLNGKDTDRHAVVWRENYHLIQTLLPEEDRPIVGEDYTLTLTITKELSEADIDMVLQDLGNFFDGPNVDVDGLRKKVENANEKFKALESLRQRNLKGGKIDYTDWVVSYMPLVSFDDDDSIAERDQKINEQIIRDIKIDMLSLK